MKKIKLFIMDVDGTLTDGQIYMGQDGELFKVFNIKDGYGIKKLLENNIIPVIITSRKSKIVELRAEELGVLEVYQAVDNKIEQLNKLAYKYGCKLDEIAYVGDDDNDFHCINMCGLSGCPDDSSQLIKENVDFVSKYDGGNGAVRDFIEYLLAKYYLN